MGKIKEENKSSYNNVKDYIDESGYRSNFIADFVGCHPSDISRWISGERKPSQERLKKLCEIIKSSIAIRKCSMRDLYPDIKWSKSYRSL